MHLHSTLRESIGMAAEVAQGICMDLPPSKKLNAYRCKQTANQKGLTGFYHSKSLLKPRQ